MNKTIEKLVKIADKLDQSGKEKLADMVDAVIQKLVNKTAGELEEELMEIQKETPESDGEEPTDKEVEHLWEDDNA